MNVIQMVFAQETFDIFRTWLLLTRGRVDFGYGDPFMQNAFMVAIDIVVGSLDVGASGQRLDLFDVLGHAFNLRGSRSHQEHESSKKGNQSTHVVSTRVEYNPSLPILSISDL